MSFLLKIVEGPNKGAEVALVEGVGVTLGNGDDCDIVLADATMPGKISLAATADGVTVDGENLELFHVKTAGATSFAIGPADAPWQELEWPALEKVRSQEEPEAKEEAKPSAEEKKPEKAEEPEKPESAEAPEKKRGGGAGCFLGLVMALLVLLALGWFAWRFLPARTGETPAPVPPATIEDIAGKYGLSLSKSNDVVKVCGNLSTRRERLSATAEAYAAMPGVELDISDDESFRTAAEDGLFTLTEGALQVAIATNRYLHVVGSVDSVASLAATMSALAADIPKLSGFDVSGVMLPGGATIEQAALDGMAQEAPKVARQAQRENIAPSLPVCGILTVPYPCLVMSDGARVLEGASIGDWIVEEIGADSVTLVNGTGRFVWKP